jgi:hypothetical protein
MKVPDPNLFDGTVMLRKGTDPNWTEMPGSFWKGCGRSIGLADMISAIRKGRAHRCDANLAFAVLDAMQGFYDASESGREYRPSFDHAIPAVLDGTLPFGRFDL